VVKYIVVGLFAVPWVGVPLWLMIVNSFKEGGEAAELSLALPTKWAIVQNYSAVFTSGNYLTGLKNSLLIAVPTVFFVLLLGAAAAWVYGRSQRRSTQFFFYLTSLSILLPPAIIPTIIELSTVGLAGSTWGYTLMLIGTRLGIIIFLTTGFVRGLPVDLEEAAEIDGASRLRIFFSIMIPLLRPILFVGAVLLVIQVWNDFFFALLLLKTTDNQTLPLALNAFANSSQYGINWNLVFAHVVMTSLPLIVLYLIAQRRVLSGLTEGGLKG
jgi:raffinose/stachyose/melibiose transport system permease protein